MQRPHEFYEFFAGGGMARAGLGSNWECIFANDFSAMKAQTYCENWGDCDFVLGDVKQISSGQLPRRADLAWASFPCQDLSLAGKYQGLGDESSRVMTRSGTFWPFWSLMTQLYREHRAPKLIVLENVVGAITSRGGRDFAAICSALADSGYRYGAVIADAKHFVPQSRPRLFFVAVAGDLALPDWLESGVANPFWHTAALCSAQAGLCGAAHDQWVWWNLPRPSSPVRSLTDIVEETPTNGRWHTAAETKRLLGMMNALHRAKIDQVRAFGTKQVGCIYKRTRHDKSGVKHQRAEVRFDDLAGCLRTPGGGSSRQLIIVVEGDNIRTRLLSPREAARLMGLEDSYKLPDRYNDAYHIAGDGVCVPVVRYLAAHLLEPLLAGDRAGRKLIAA